MVFSLAAEASDLIWSESTSTKDELESETDGGAGARLPFDGMSVFGILGCDGVSECAVQ